MSVDIQDVITCATFCDDRLRGSGVARGRISRFPIDLRRRPYNTLALPCECVIATIERRRNAFSVHHHHVTRVDRLNQSDEPRQAVCKALPVRLAWPGVRMCLMKR